MNNSEVLSNSNKLSSLLYLLIFISICLASAITYQYQSDKYSPTKLNDISLNSATSKSFSR